MVQRSRSARPLPGKIVIGNPEDISLQGDDIVVRIREVVEKKVREKVGDQLVEKLKKGIAFVGETVLDRDATVAVYLDGGTDPGLGFVADTLEQYPGLDHFIPDEARRVLAGFDALGFYPVQPMDITALGAFVKVAIAEGKRDAHLAVNGWLRFKARYGTFPGPSVAALAEGKAAERVKNPYAQREIASLEAELRRGNSVLLITKYPAWAAAIRWQLSARIKDLAGESIGSLDSDGIWMNAREFDGRPLRSNAQNIIGAPALSNLTQAARLRMENLLDLDELAYERDPDLGDFVSLFNPVHALEYLSFGAAKLA
jgi:hypothetical protein